MENNLPEAAAASGGIVAPKMPPRVELAHEPFEASKREWTAALLMYPLAYLYMRMYGVLLGGPDEALALGMLAAFACGFFALGEYLCRGVPRARESWLWLGCSAVILCAVVFRRGNAWESGAPYFFLHVFAVWWALSRSGALLEGESGRLLPLDALDGFVVFPFCHFFLRVRAVGFALSRLRARREKEKPEERAPGWTVLISAAALGLFAFACVLLADADSGFAELIAGITERFRFDLQLDVLFTFFLRLLFSLPVGAYLFGLLAGARREDKAALHRRAANVDETLEMLRGVPARVWLALLALFCALYAIFFAVQGRYLFGACTRTLPEGFVVAEYARQGFFELCKVMAVNFALLWLVLRSAKEDVRAPGALRALCLVLLAESFLLAVVALSKLGLYIDCFGFPPRRLESTWLACVLAFGCGCSAWSLLRGGKCFRVWMYASAVTLALLCLY